MGGGHGGGRWRVFGRRHWQSFLLRFRQRNPLLLCSLRSLFREPLLLRSLFRESFLHRFFFCNAFLLGLVGARLFEARLFGLRGSETLLFGLFRSFSVETRLLG